MKEKFIGVGERIAERLNQLEIKQSELSKCTNISANAISNYVSGNRTPDTSSLYLIAKALSTTMEWLLTGLNPTVENFTEQELDLVNFFRQLDNRDKREMILIAKMKVSEDRLGNNNQSLISNNGNKNITKNEGSAGTA